MMRRVHRECAPSGPEIPPRHLKDGDVGVGRFEMRRTVACTVRSPLYEVECLTVEHTKISLGQSRHWVAVWLWFLS